MQFRTSSVRPDARGKVEHLCQVGRRTEPSGQCLTKKRLAAKQDITKMANDCKKSAHVGTQINTQYTETAFKTCLL